MSLHSVLERGFCKFSILFIGEMGGINGQIFFFVLSKEKRTLESVIE